MGVVLSNRTLLSNEFGSTKEHTQMIDNYAP